MTDLEPVVRTVRLPDECPRCHVVDSDRIRSWRDSRDVIWQVRQCAACFVLWLELPPMTGFPCAAIYTDSMPTSRGYHHPHKCDKDAGHSGSHRCEVCGGTWRDEKP